MACRLLKPARGHNVGVTRVTNDRQPCTFLRQRSSVRGVGPQRSFFRATGGPHGAPSLAPDLVLLCRCVSALT